MLTEVVCMIGVVLLVFFIIKDKDWRYIVGFVLGFLASIFLESHGVAVGSWTWENIAYPFNFLILKVPVSVLLIYSSAAGLVLPLTKYIDNLREREEFKQDLDEISSYLALAAGVLLLFFSSNLGIGLSVGASLIMFGLYLQVKNPTALYIGTLILVSDFVIEYGMMSLGQLSYRASYGDVGTGFFVLGTIIASLYLLSKDGG